MTVMMPDRPHLGATRSEAEVFDRIRSAPGSEQWYCLHSLGLARHRRKSYAECDFILIGPSGVFCLEVKGGEVRRLGGVWHIGWPGSEYTSVEGPFRQAQSCRWAIVEELGRRRPSALRSPVMVGWGVVFPDIRFEEQDPEWDLDVVHDVTDKSSGFLRYVERLVEYTRSRELVGGRRYPDRLGPDEIRMVVDCFRHDFDLVRLLGDLISESGRELAALSVEQYRVLDCMLHPSNQRVLCPGAAGTGKTLIALEAALRLARQGRRVLLLCYNRLLAEDLSRTTAGAEGQIVVNSLHRFMWDVVERAGMSAGLAAQKDSLAGDDRFYQQDFPGVFEEAVLNLLDEGTLEKFDTLIVDEGQDILHSPTIDALECTLAGGFKDGRWLIFYDPNLQAEIYGRMDQRVVDGLMRHRPVTLPLLENFRNPLGIVKEMCALTGLSLPKCRRLIVSTVDYVSHSSPEEQGRKLRAILVDLLRTGVEASQVTILSGCRREASCVFRYPPNVGKPVVHLEAPVTGNAHRQGFTTSTVSAFKGLENEVIILTDLPVPDPSRAWERSVAYVGMTRARTKVHALVTDEFLQARFRS